MSIDRYDSPLSGRYASKEMQYIFSQDKKFTTWRKLWIALAEAERELGLNITEEQIAELKEHVNDINYDVAIAREKEVRHDVMSHVYAYGVQCPKAKGIIHLGATSCYVGDNTDIIIMTEGLKLVKKKLLNVMSKLAQFAEKYRGLPTLAFTHFQPAQPTTVGKRATLWLMELKLDYDDICYLIDSMKLLGSKGTTGTQASFLELFDGDHEKIKKIDKLIAEKSERIASLSRYVMSDLMNPYITAATQWFERTLDDSANKRLSVPEAFLAIDGILDLYMNVADGLVVYEKVIEKHIMAELPFMATENIMMDAVKRGGDRQELHEKIRTLSMEAGKNVKERGLDNNLLELIAAEPSFGITLDELKKQMDPSKYTGRSKEQVEDFLKEVIRPILEENKAELGLEAEINV